MLRLPSGQIQPPCSFVDLEGGQKPGRCGGTGAGCFYEGVQEPLFVQRGMQFLHLDLPDRLQHGHLGDAEKETRVSGDRRIGSQ